MSGTPDRPVRPATAEAGAGLLIGTSTSALPWEGSVAATDGPGPDETAFEPASLTVWDVFSGLPDRIADGSVPGDGASGTRRWREDLDRLVDLGVTAHRLTLSWARLAPHRRVDPAGPGIDFYRRLLDGLGERGIAAWVGLHHWDMPLPLMERGGWLVRETADEFADFAGAVGDLLGDRVAAWTTVDEPGPLTALGYAVGIDAPGLTLLGGAFSAAHHQLLAHGLGVTALRSAGSTSRTAAVGVVNTHSVVRPADPDSRADRSAARFVDLYLNRQFADPVLRGRYPRALQRAIPEMLDDTLVRPGDLEIIGGPLDFYGVAWDHLVTVTAVPENRSVPFSLDTPADLPLTANGRPIDPGALTEVLTALASRYPDAPPLVVASCGGAFDPAIDPSHVHRIAYLDTHLAATDAARSAGADVRAYFHRSLTDGWEWTDGWAARFGLIAVDPITGNRSGRPAFDHLRRRIAENGRVRWLPGSPRPA